ncbi:hypothetical protein FGIG_10476 [Fasciola gigantica]|uniref:CCDC92/74 N-terminal domain-containing protein n=1 Tax=Fasciola gigantica TaxID=46835 RepID=A0A504YU59_FASGI|nr:hypothetical protein FGIG_10476 [Fasciola gigantica]
MLSIERTCLRPTTASDQKNCETVLKSNETFQSPTRTSTKDEFVSGESKISTLEKNINFLRAQHEVMLRSLHEEIENLRKSNKALQFRLVMCSCSASCHMKIDETPSSLTSNLESEVQTLKKLLDEEKHRNQSLLAQMEAMQLARSVVAEQTDVKNTAVCVAQRGVKQCSVEHITKPSPSGTSIRYIRGSAVNESHRTDHSEMSKTEPTLVPFPTYNSGHSRVASPDMKTEGSSSAFVITPRTTCTAPDSLWVRRSVPTLIDVVSVHGASHQPLGCPQNGVSGSHVVPSRLPALRNGKSLAPTAQASSQTLANLRLPENGTHHGLPNSHKPSSTLSNESSQTKAARSARTSLGNNSIAVFDPVSEFSNTYPVDLGRTSRPYSSNLGPFLPALPKTGDAGQVARQRKARILQRKRMDRTQDMFPP